MVSKMIEDIVHYFNAGYPAIAISSSEENRVIREIKTVAERNKVKLYYGSITQGIICVYDPSSGGSTESIIRKAPVTGMPPTDFLDFIIDRSRDTKGDDEWIVIVDVHSFLSKVNVYRRFKDACNVLRTSQPFKRIILLSHAFQIPIEMEHEISMVNLTLPTKAELDPMLKDVIASLRGVAKHAGKKITLPESKAEIDALLEAARGMTLLEAENAYALSYQRTKHLDPQLVMNEKVQIIKKSGLLELYPTMEDLGRVGGNGELKQWLKTRKRAFSEEAAKYGLPTPKGVLLLGVQGCGKSLTAKCIAAEWKLPLLRLDAGKLFGGIVGQTEENTRKFIQLAEAVAPVVVWIDEIDKGMATPEGSVTGGGEVTRHMVGTMCTWLSEKTSPVFVVATANSISTFPPELLRKGRFDEIFFVDLPTLEEREEIISIIIKNRKRNPEDYNLSEIASATNEFSGAEIEQGFIEAMNNAFYLYREVNNDDYIDAVKRTTPLSKTKEDDIRKLRDWAKGRARFASTQNEQIRTSSRAMKL